jgi:hypothetical protein
VNLSTFSIIYPEFDEADPTMVQAHLEQAAARLHAETWGDRYDEIHGLETAHDLAMSPFGRALRQDGSETSIYQARIQRVRAEVLPRWGIA